MNEVYKEHNILNEKDSLAYCCCPVTGQSWQFFTVNILLMFMFDAEKEISFKEPEPVEVNVCKEEAEINDVKPDLSTTTGCTLACTVNDENYNLADSTNVTSQSAEQCAFDMPEADATENPSSLNADSVSQRKHVRQSRSGLVLFS